MHFIRTTQSANAAQKVAAEITAALHQHQSVLWFVSGGSAISVAVQARQLLKGTVGLTVLQIDERYGPVGHPDSNWQQLLAAGFNTDGVDCHPILIGQDLAQTTETYTQLVKDMLAKTNYVFGLFGMGADGHTAGILPGSPAATSSEFVTSYQGPDYLRITLTPSALIMINAAVLYATGESKVPALQNLLTELPVSEQPAQLLKQAGDLWIYNDQLGELA